MPRPRSGTALDTPESTKLAQLPSISDALRQQSLGTSMDASKLVTISGDSNTEVTQNASGLDPTQGIHVMLPSLLRKPYLKKSDQIQNWSLKLKLGTEKHRASITPRNMYQKSKNLTSIGEGSNHPLTIPARRVGKCL